MIKLRMNGSDKDQISICNNILEHIYKHNYIAVQLERADQLLDLYKLMKIVIGTIIRYNNKISVDDFKIEKVRIKQINKRNEIGLLMKIKPTTEWTSFKQKTIIRIN